MQTSEKMQDVVRVTLLLDERRVERDCRPGEVLAWLQSAVVGEMKFGRIEKVFAHGDWMETVDEEMQWTVGERYVV